MLVELTKRICNLDGTPMADESATIRTVCCNALMGNFPDERELSGADKAKRYHLALRIQGAEKLDLTAEQVTLLKGLVGKAYGPLIVGQVWESLDPVAAE